MPEAPRSDDESVGEDEYQLVADDQSQVKNASSSARANGRERSNICPQCRTELAPNAVICVECGLDLATGTRLSVQRQIDNEVEQVTFRERLNGLIDTLVPHRFVIFLVVAVIVGVPAYWFINNRISDEDRRKMEEFARTVLADSFTTRENIKVRGTWGRLWKVSGDISFKGKKIGSFHCYMGRVQRDDGLTKVRLEKWHWDMDKEIFEQSDRAFRELDMYRSSPGILREQARKVPLLVLYYIQEKKGTPNERDKNADLLRGINDVIKEKEQAKEWW